MELIMSDEGPKHIIEGFSTDLESISQKFVSNYPQCRLIDFLGLWDEEHLDCLFANRFDPRELTEAISEMNLHLTEVLVSPGEDAMKIISIYLLLCIYIKQPERFRSKFRWTCRDLIATESWCNKIAENSNNTHPRQALKQLKALGAFDLVEESKIYGPTMIRRGSGDVGSKSISIITSPLSEERKETIEFLESKIEPCLTELRNIHTNYNHIRQVLELANYSEIGEQTTTNTSPGVYLDQAANSVAEFKSNLNQ